MVWLVSVLVNKIVSTGPVSSMNPPGVTSTWLLLYNTDCVANLVFGNDGIVSHRPLSTLYLYTAALYLHVSVHISLCAWSHTMLCQYMSPGRFVCLVHADPGPVQLYMSCRVGRPPEHHAVWSSTQQRIPQTYNNITHITSSITNISSIRHHENNIYCKFRLQQITIRHKTET